jgi:hypothetical protein
MGQCRSRFISRSNKSWSRDYLLQQECCHVARSHIHTHTHTHSNTHQQEQPDQKKQSEQETGAQARGLMITHTAEIYKEHRLHTHELDKNQRLQATCSTYTLSHTHTPTHKYLNNVSLTARAQGLCAGPHPVPQLNPDTQLPRIIATNSGSTTLATAGCLISVSETIYTPS